MLRIFIVVELVWLYLVLAIVLSAAILLGCCVVMDYSTYRDLQRRLQEERRRRLKESPVAGYI
jgi:sensor domain CHASE-containing protein